MSESRNVGDILVGLGRLTRNEVDQALIFQKRNGGYFGEALISLHLVTRQDLDWVLATQFDMPYVVPNADEVDPAAASLVTPEWALAHTALPILKADDVLTVVLAEPNRQAAALEQLRVRTGKQLSLALASPDTVHDLIRAVFGRLAEEERSCGAPSSVTELWDSAVRAGAAGLGISARGPTAWGWFRAGDRIERSRLNARWEHDLRRLLDPDPEEAIDGRDLGRWRAELECHGLRSHVDVAYLRSSGGTELFIRPVAGSETDDILPPGPAVVSEISALVQSGGAHFRVVCDPPSLCAIVLPRIPALVLTESARSIHLTDRDAEPPRHVASLRLATDPDRREAQMASVCAFDFDVVTAELAAPSAGDLAGIARIAPTLFAAVPDGGPDSAAHTPCPWELKIDGNEEGRLVWRLRRLQS